MNINRNGEKLKHDLKREGHCLSWPFSNSHASRPAFINRQSTLKYGV